MNFRTFLKLSKCKALGDFLISFSEITIPKGCLGGINQNSISSELICDSRYFPTLALKRLQLGEFAKQPTLKGPYKGSATLY